MFNSLQYSTLYSYLYSSLCRKYIDIFTFCCLCRKFVQALCPFLYGVICFLLLCKFLTYFGY
jgi:hypothetical protein